MKAYLYLVSIILPLFLFEVSAATISIRLIETSDLHSNIMDYDYYKNRPTQKFGLVRTASLIRAAQGQVKNSLLIDNGDLLQGSPMGDYMATEGLQQGDIHSVYKVMNSLGYQVANIGNHEFNYGLDYLNEAINDANFPYINANVYDLKTQKNLFKPYFIKSYQFKDSHNKLQTIKVGYIGFVPPQILLWDKKNLSGKVVVKDITETARLLVPKMKAEGADIIVAIPHSGISTLSYKPMAEDSILYLSKVADIDAILFGHSHALFPSDDFANVPGVDLSDGTINHIPATMPGRWGDHIGVIDLQLEQIKGKWQVIKSHAETRGIFDSKNNKALVDADPQSLALIKSDHQKTLAYVSEPIGHSSSQLFSYLALVQDDASVQIVNAAQVAYAKNLVDGDATLSKLPILSAASPFRTGGRKNDPDNFTEIDKGAMSFRNASDLYLYSNTLVVLKVTGDDVRQWLECSASLFNQIDVNSSAAQTLINWNGFRSYNFDVIDGVSYQIDVTQAARYDGECQLINENSQRVYALTYNDLPIDKNQEFLLVTNNYRAYGNKFQGAKLSNVVFDTPDQNRAVLIDYIKTISKENGAINPQADDNWQFKKIHSAVKLQLLFETANSPRAKSYIKQHARYPMRYILRDELGFAVYEIDLK